MFLWHQELQEWSIYSAFLARLVPVAVSRTKQTLKNVLRYACLFLHLLGESREKKEPHYRDFARGSIRPHKSGCLVLCTVKRVL